MSAASGGGEAGGGPAAALPRRTEVLVIGAGFAGLEVARALGAAGVETTVVDRRNHHLFQPLLYQVATAALSAPDIAEPIRRILRRHASVSVLFGEVGRIDAEARRVELTCGQTIAYRRLVLATGAGHSYFGHDDWARWAPGLKTVEDAQRIRARLLMTFERAERTDDPRERARLLSVAIVGGGPTGVELAGSIAELSRFTLARDFRSIDPRATRITLIEAGPRILSGFSEDSSAYAERRLERLGVTVRTGEAVEDVGPREVRVAGQSLPVGLVIWAAGVAASPLAADLGPMDPAGRVAVDACLRVEGREDVFALGDVARFTGEDGAPLPGLAQVARQQGMHLGRTLSAHLVRGTPLEPFRYESRGNTAIVGRHVAVFERDGRRLTGWVAWLAWAVVHVYLLVGFQNRFLVSVQWLWRYLTYERGARLIAGNDPEFADPDAAPTPRARKRKAASAAAGGTRGAS